MKYLLPGLFFLFSVITVIVIYYPEQSHEELPVDYNRLVITSTNAEGNPVQHVFSVEVARTTREKNMGLMFRMEMPENNGMIFLNEKPRRAAMWMKNTYIPLDMVFINEAWNIQAIVKNTEPHSLDVISPEGEVIAVLELNGGITDKYHIVAGDKVTLEE